MPTRGSVIIGVLLRIAVDAQLLHACRCDDEDRDWKAKQVAWDCTGAITSSAPAMAYKRKPDGSAKRKRESDFATATDSPLLGLSGRLCGVHSVLCLSKIENQSERTSVGTKLVQLFGSTMIIYVLEKPSRSLSANAPQNPRHRGFEENLDHPAHPA